MSAAPAPDSDPASIARSTSDSSAATATSVDSSAAVPCEICGKVFPADSMYACSGTCGVGRMCVRAVRRWDEPLGRYCGTYVPFKDEAFCRVCDEDAAAWGEELADATFSSRLYHQILNQVVPKDVYDHIHYLHKRFTTERCAEKAASDPAASGGAGSSASL